jgi:hypothetical protein
MKEVRTREDDMETSNAMGNLATAAVALLNAIIALALGTAALTLIHG